MQARQVENLPKPAPERHMRFEPKWDGFRALALVDDQRAVTLLSRRGKPLGRGFPEIVRAIEEHLPADTIVDGELVVWSAQGRLDFTALQHRNSAGRAVVQQLMADEPAHMIVFDVLRISGTDITARPLSERRAVLEDLFAEIPDASPLALGMQTEDVAVAGEWFRDLAPVGVEGIVIKPANSPYRPGDRGIWQKVKHYASTEAIIGGVTGSIGQPRELLLGRYSSETGEFRVIGRTVPLHTAAAATVAAALQPADDEHPWPPTLPGGWTGAGVTEYARVRPEVVAEIRVDVAAQAGRWRHGLRYLRLRTDLTPADVPLDLETH